MFTQLAKSQGCLASQQNDLWAAQGDGRERICALGIVVSDVSARGETGSSRWLALGLPLQLSLLSAPLSPWSER